MRKLPNSDWSSWSVKDRLQVVGRVRGMIADRALELARLVPRDSAETLVTEILPLAEACKFLQREAESILAPRRLTEGRPVWLSGTELEVRREPLGTVLVIGPSNYPLFLAAVHAIQALVAGNRVILKPGRGGQASLAALAQMLGDAGLPAEALTLLGEDPAEAQRAIQAGVDKVILTGSNATGQSVMATLAEHVTPSVMELSGCDSVFIRDDADLPVVARALRFGLTLNKGNTCIAPRRVYVSRRRAEEFRKHVGSLPIPVIEVDSETDAIEQSQSCGYALGASVFGSVNGARQMAERIRAGVVVVNDMIMPTADPRLPFGGRGKSGFGVTRGAEGLLEMTAVKAIVVRTGSWRPHYDPSHPVDRDLFAGFVAALHGSSWRRRLEGFLQLSRAGMARRKAA